MLQIRLSRAPASEGSAGAKLSPFETVMVACPDHLVLADLPVAKGIGGATAASHVKTLGRRSRRQLGERVHFCVRCDFPIAIYGRLSPCEHAFCLDCSRSDSLCYLCDERIQKIQTIKMMEGILICAAPHCLKSFLKKADFESHVQDVHANLLRSNADKEDGNESEVQSVRQSTASDSTARGPQRPVFSPTSNPQLHDQEEKTRRQPPRDQPPSWPNMQSKPPYFGQQHHPSDAPSGSIGGFQQGFHQQSFDIHHPSIEPSQFSDRQQSVGPEYPPMHSGQPPNIPTQVTSNPMLNPPVPFGYPPYPHERGQPFYAAPYDNIPKQDSASDISRDQNSLLGFPQGGVPKFPGNYPQSWHAGMGGAPFEQGQGGMAVDPRDAKGVLAPQPVAAPPPPPPATHMSHMKPNYYSNEGGHDHGQGYGWQQQHDNRDSFGGQG
ncbi:putative transcription factor interactor and regulator LIM family [Lupinus albus]|uniref:RING-type E3 ubiquitin transferase n=1 Tax=Lupinus albus TaxID=3870 RepID=A0A6A4RAW4_LUPAL|nr:putative transcription factor interactor and regulator LIM family [Lupinus albus]